MSILLTGRKPLICDKSAISSADEMTAELKRILDYFELNQNEILYLRNYYKGYHPEIYNREKAVREDVDNKVTVNFALSATRDIVGYYLGKPIQYVHRDETSKVIINKLTRILDAENKNLVNKKIAEDQSVCGTAYMGIFKDLVKKNGTSLKLKHLDPAQTFVVYSSSPDVDELYCCTFYTTQTDIERGEVPATFYTIWTSTHRYEFTKKNGSLTCTSMTPFSYGGYLPIQEYPNNQYRMGDWEAAVTLMDAIDGTASDRQNDIQQTVQSILVALGIELTPDTLTQLKTDKLLNVPSVAEGAHDPVIEYLNAPLDTSVGSSFSEYLEASMNVVIGIPDRQSRAGGGGDTGTAVELRDGWMDIDLVASFKEGYFIESDRNALGAILYLLKTNKELEQLEVYDIEIKFSRNKTANIQVKAQALSTLLSAGIHPQDAIEWCDLTTDVLAVVTRMEEYKVQKQDETIAFADKQAAVSAKYSTNNDGNGNATSNATNV